MLKCNRVLLFFSSFVTLPIVVAQNVGVGTLSPTARLHIEIPSGFTSPVLLANQNGSTTPYLIVQPDGKVGIGVASPLSRLHLVDTLVGSTSPDIGIRYDINVVPSSSASNVNFYGRRLTVSLTPGYSGNIERIVGDYTGVVINDGNDNVVIGHHKYVDLASGQVSDLRASHSYLAIRAGGKVSQRAISNSAYLYNYSDSAPYRLYAYYGDLHHFGKGKPMYIRGMGLHVQLDSPMNNNGDLMGYYASVENRNPSLDTLHYAAGIYTGVLNRGRGYLRYARGGYFYVVNDTVGPGGMTNGIIDGIGVMSVVENRVSGQAISKAVTISGEIINKSTISSVIGIKTQIFNDTNSVIDEAVGVHVSAGNALNATINKWQGIYIYSNSNNIQPNHWAIYSDDVSPSYFKGSIGIGIINPTERLDVSGNVQFSGALMPGGNAGSSGQVLVSQGPGTAPQWQNLSLTYSFKPQWTDYLDTLGNQVGCSGAMTMTWEKCAEVCINLTLGGFNDWRLPTIEEAVWSHKTLGLGACNTEFFTMSFDLDGAHHHWDVFNPATFTMGWAHIGDVKTCRCVR